MSWISLLKKLRPEIRNKVRAILSIDNPYQLLNKYRLELKAGDILQIENVIREFSNNNNALIPDLFPKQPQTSENFQRLSLIDISKSLQIIEALIYENYSTLCNFFSDIGVLDKAIINKDFDRGSQAVKHVFDKYGYSHYLLRKAILLNSIKKQDVILPEIEDFLKHVGYEKNNLIITSLIHCYLEEQDFLTLKKSIMGLPDRKMANQYTRDISRIPFHPIAKNTNDLANILQSNIQSSLIDAVIAIKTNIKLLKELIKEQSTLLKLLDAIETKAESINEIASMYPSNDPFSESTFYKHSSAWLENSEIVEYRALQDHFFDSPESDYFEITEELIARIKKWIVPLELSQLAKADNLTNHKHPNLKILENGGNVTRSSIFNYCVHINTGYSKIKEDDLVWLMGHTSSLAKTINPEYLDKLAQLADTKMSQLILYLLIARKSKDDLYSHRLRRLFQNIVIQEYDGDIVRLLDAIHKRSGEIAEFIYDVATEDFIGKLFHIIKTASEITETRASLHKWMGVITGEKVYFDRARTLLIDQQLNKIRDEIDDNRIYVDSARFIEWVNDEVMRDIYTILTSLDHKQELVEAEICQLENIIEKCFVAFCSNTVFGIASYLGRRIRHGTFKGHLYSSVIRIERSEKYKTLFDYHSFSTKWDQWKREYEGQIDYIIQNRIHIASSSKREGLLNPNINTTIKREILSAGAKSIAEQFSKTKNSSLVPNIIVEICWNIVEVDLRNINAFLKHQKVSLINNHELIDLKIVFNHSNKLMAVATEFCRDLAHLVDDKLASMYNWFKRPINIAPKASLSLLYKAVVAEVKDTFPDFDTDTEFEPKDDIELLGDAYLIIYDALYVIVYNAAKHGKPGEQIERNFNIIMDKDKPEKRLLELRFTSIIKDDEPESYVVQRLRLNPGDNVSDAQILEGRSGIRKLYQMAQTRKEFSVNRIECRDRMVLIDLSLAIIV